MSQYRKKPVEIEAHQITVFNLEWIEQWCGGMQDNIRADARYRMILIPTLEGVMQARVGDYVIKGVKGEFYPCKADIFAATYTPA